MRPNRLSGAGARNPTDVLAAISVGAVIIAGLYFGRDLLVPLALAVMLSFILTPLVLKLRTWGVGRSASVVLVVTLAFLIIFGLGVVIARQITELAEGLPRYESTLRAKLKDLRPTSQSGGLIDRASDAIKQLGQELKPGQEQAPAKQPTREPSSNPEPKPVPVEIQKPPRRPLDYAKDAASALLQPLTTAGIVVIFVVFILMQREDLKDRLIRLVGGNDLERTTAAISEAAERLSRYFFTYTIMNATYGTLVALALWAIGIPNPALWGILAALMRFVPYVGSIIAGSLPVILAAAVFPGWTTALVTVGLFIVSEALMGQVMEPWLLGRATGLSPLAAIVSLSFWAWLWGPVGLVLAIPLSVCLTVLARHVEPLSFLDVLLGDEPALTPAQTFYQRLLTGDSAEIIHQAEECLKQTSLLTYMDTVALPGLLLARDDARRGRFTAERLQQMEEVIDEIVEELQHSEERSKGNQEDDEKGDERAPLPVLDADQLRPEWRADGAVLCIGVRNALDLAAAKILALLATRHGLKCRVIGHQEVGPAMIGALPMTNTQVTVLCYLDAAGAPAYAKYLLRRLRRRKPDVGVILGFWGESPFATREFTAEADEGTKQAGTFREALSALLATAKLPDETESAATVKNELASAEPP